MTSQISDVVAKLGRTEGTVQHRCSIGAMSPVIAAARAASKAKLAGETDKEAASEETALAKAVRDSYVPLPPPPETRLTGLNSTKVSLEASHGLIGALLKDSIFNGGRLAQEGGNAGTGFKLPPL